jgi:vacuolar protein sorting-associated protein 13A/C
MIDRQVGAWSGEVVLQNLKIKPSALKGLNLPLSVRQGLVGSIKLNLNWAKLGSVPVKISFADVWILGEPRYDWDQKQVLDSSSFFCLLLSSSNVVFRPKILFSKPNEQFWTR